MHDATDALIAADLAARTQRGHPADGVIFAARSEAQAARIAAAMRVLAPGAPLVTLPAWDCLPHDRVSPSLAVMGSRMTAMRSLAEPGPHLLVASVASLAQRLPQPDAASVLTIEPGADLAAETLEAHLLRFGYVREPVAAQPGEFAIQGEVVDIVAADASGAARIRLGADGGVAGIDRFDPATQRSRSAIPRLLLGPASELVFSEPRERPPGLEHRLPEFYPALCGAFDLLPDAALYLDPDSDERMQSWLAQVEEARETRVALTRAAGGALPVAGLYLDRAAWEAVRARGQEIEEAGPATLPEFTRGRERLAACLDWIGQQAGAGTRVGISGPRLARALRLEDAAATSWAGLQAAGAGTVARLPPGLAAGFVWKDVAIVTDADIWPPREAEADPARLFAQEMRPGDAVVHLDHGVARLEGIETVSASAPADCLVLGFAGGARKLVPCAEMDRIWRQGSGTEGVTLDRADDSTWLRRVREIEASIDATARGLLQQVQARRQVAAPVLRAPVRAMRRFVAGFAYAPTVDQRAAFDAVAADLARSFPMDRLVCGDVGFGKTEIALRAAAIAALGGRQVAILAPTTVLVRQHLETFSRRFAAIGIEVASLSRLSSPSEARRVRERLASGDLRVVIGTTALAGKTVRFAELGLLVIDEEQRFGTRDKTALARLRPGIHTLNMTATPIPRTLESTLAGLRDISVLASPPAERLPLRTAVEPFDLAVIAAALRREHARGGQSFFVCPRIKDLAPTAETLSRLVPELSAVLLHGAMQPADIDAALVGFAAGRGDVLLSTDIVEAGLDVPRANTILVRDADRLGLAQLHQLRGRVGRGRARGQVFLFTDPQRPPTRAAAKRLAALEGHDGLGGGFAIAASDLDLRGGGELLGETQAGHVSLLGVDLARHLLRRALARASHAGQADDEAMAPQLVLDVPAYLPADYIPDAALRIALHVRLGRPHDRAELEQEIADRFGPPPEPVTTLLALAELRQACRELGVVKLEAGPDAVAAELREPASSHPSRHPRVLLRRASATAQQRLDAAWTMLRSVSQREQASAA